jgi:CheY-like chemotaxis protein
MDAAPLAPAHAPSPALLIADDSPAVRGFLRAALRPWGFTVLEAADGHEALDLYRRHRAAVRLVLLDVRMPGLDGPQTLAALRRLDPGVRCCFLSGVLGEADARALLGQGALRVFHKPAAVGPFLQAVRELAQPPEAPPLAG